MIRLSYSRLLTTTCFMLALGVFVSCNKDDNDKPNDGKAALYSFGPTGAKVGDTLRFIGVNLDQVASVKFTGLNATVEKSNFKFQASDLITLLVPASTERGKLVLKLSNGDSIVTKTPLNIGVKVTVASMTNQVRYGDNVTITGNYLNWVNKVTFAKGKMVQTFVSQSMNQLVVKAPADAENGPLLISYSGTDSAEIQTADTLKFIIPQVTNMSPNPIDTGANLTITGTNVDLVSSVSFLNVTSPVINFVSQSATQLVVKVPGAALRGKLTFGIKNSTLTVQSPMDLTLNTLPPLADFPFAIYTDALQNTFQDWSYTATHDFNSTANVRQGTKSIKSVYATGGYQGTTFHAGTAASTTGYTVLEFSVFGETGTNGKKLNVVINGNYSSPPQVTVVEGAWTTFSLPFSGLGSPATIGEIVLQSAGWGGTLHIDHVGFR